MKRDISTHPISSIQWLEVTTLQANDYNPNHVLTPELKLLKRSLLAQGWIQPILVVKGPEGTHTIVDGFHRHLLAKTDKEVNSMTEGLVPCAVLELSDNERKVLTVRINRAKGVHSAVRMHELVTDLYNSGMSIKEIGQEIGADKHEIDLLLKESVFKKLDTENHKYTEAWVAAE